MSDLKSCPFCGENAELFIWSFDGAIDARCSSCPCTMNAEWEEAREAIKAWNTRTDKANESTA